MLRLAFQRRNFPRMPRHFGSLGCSTTSFGPHGSKFFCQVWRTLNQWLETWSILPHPVVVFPVWFDPNTVLFLNCNPRWTFMADSSMEWRGDKHRAISIVFYIYILNILIRVYNYQYIPRSHCIINLSNMVKTTTKETMNAGANSINRVPASAGKAVYFWGVDL